MERELYCAVAACRSVQGLPVVSRTDPAAITLSRDPEIQQLATAIKHQVDRMPPLTAEQIEALRGLLPYPHPTREATPAA